MNKTRAIRKAIVSALLVAWGTSGVAFAVDEAEPNTPVTSAQPLVFGPDNTVTVFGRIGPASGAQQLDADLYTFQANKCDVVTVDIDGAWTADLYGLDANIALFGPFGDEPYHIYRQEDNTSPVDPGSVDLFDPRIENYPLPATGTYVVGVSGIPATFVDINTLSMSELDLNSNGAYTLIITRLPTPCPSEVTEINIEVKPGTHDVTPINPKAKGSIPVALLSSDNFDALRVDPKTLTFGATGNEESWLRCNMEGVDVNRDGRPDLLCHFDNAKAKFAVGDSEGTVKGKTTSGTAFKGTGWLKVVPGKRRR